MTVLDVTDVTKSYRGRRVLGPVDLSINAGSYHAILGPNGAGKSTLLHIATGLIPATSGTVTINGKSIADRLTKLDLGFAPDDQPLPGSLTGLEFLTLHNRLRSRAGDVDRCVDLAQLFGIQDDLKRQIDEYSHGMRRKLQFVAAVSHEPRLLVLDEPFRGLDPRSSVILRRFLDEYAQGSRAVVVATHDMVRAERDCRSITLIDGGRVAATGSPADLRVLADNAPDLETAFDILTVDPAESDATDALLVSLTPTKGT